jgi:ATP-binding cassette subfamily D (ALD) long-chain fatty acid import protein
MCVLRMITNDIQRFSTSLAAVYSNLAKPTLDVILYNYQLSQNVGAEGIIGLTFFVNLSAMLCKYSFISSIIEVNNASSAIHDASIRHVHCTLCPNGRVTATHPLSPR